MESDLSNLGRFIQQWRQSHGDKLNYVASQLGVSVSTWNHWETGRRVPKLHNILMLAEYTKIPFECFFCSENCACQKLRSPQLEKRCPLG